MKADRLGSIWTFSNAALFFSVKSIELGSFLQDPKAKKEKGKGAKNYRSMKEEKNYV